METTPSRGQTGDVSQETERRKALALLEYRARARAVLAVFWDGKPDAQDALRELVGLAGGRVQFDTSRGELVAVVRCRGSFRRHEPGVWLVLDGPGVVIQMRPAAFERAFEQPRGAMPLPDGVAPPSETLLATMRLAAGKGG